MLWYSLLAAGAFAQLNLPFLEEADSAAQWILHNALPHHSGYELASTLLNEESGNQDVRDALNELWTNNPDRFKLLLNPYAGPGGKPAKVNRRTNWDLHIQNDNFPNHQVRVKNPKALGIDNVKQLAGYLDVLDEDKHFFFWLFESRNDPANDPVVLWLNGGPGCSSSTGQFFELGPSAIQEDLSLKYNPHSWNNNATVIFLDQPVNVGYSYSSQRVSTSMAAGEDIYAFLSMFFESFPEYNNRDFHISGESYAGHYIPAIGKAIVEHPERNFNLTSLLIGNGITDTLNQVEASIAMQCGEGGFPAFQSEETCEQMYRELPRCQVLMQNCYDTRSRLVCLAATSYCGRPSTKFSETGRNPYDVRDVCNDSCYPQTGWIEQYLNQEAVKDAVGAEPIEFVGCDPQVGSEFFFQADHSVNFAPVVAEILAADIPILIYAGDKDWICNWLGNRDWTNRLEWPHHEEFADAKVQPWFVDGKESGTTKNADLLTFLRIYDAGHMVPFNQPRNAVAMLNHWISGHLRFDEPEDK